MKYIVRDGVRLFYQEKGTGEQVYVFIHGTGGDHSQLTAEYEYFSKLGRVIIFDLRGHGLSDKPEQEYSIEGFAADIHCLCRELKVKKAVFVGASMGGDIALEMAGRYLEFVSGIVILDSSIIHSEKVSEVIASYAESFEKLPIKEAVDILVNNTCLETDQCKPLLKEMYVKTPSYVWSSCFANMIPWDKNSVKDLIKKAKAPMLYIEAKNRISNLDLFKELCPGLVTAKVVGSGHLISLEVPEQVNPMIERFVRIYL